MGQENSDHVQWFADKVQPHEPALRSHLHGSFPTVRDVDDIVQEAFLRIIRARMVQPIKSAKAFLFKVARNLAVDRLRHEKVSAIETALDWQALEVIEDRPDAAENACTDHEIGLLAEAIESLPPRCREIVILRKLQGVSQKEIAAQLGISEQTVQVQAARGLKRCERFLRRRGALEDRL